MLALPGLVCLIIFIVARPFDFVPSLRLVPFLYIFFAMAVVGFLFDISQKSVVWRRGLHLPWAIALVCWALFTVLLRDAGALTDAYITVFIPFSLYFLTAHGVANFRGFTLLADVFLACTLMVSFACFYQGLQPLSCVAYKAPYQRGSDPVFYGGPCSFRDECTADMPDPNLAFQCEKVGLAGSVSIGGRVAYVGVLNDPNESALAVSIGIPFAIARYRRRRSLGRGLTLIAALVLAAGTVIMSESRGGQLVFMSAIGVYFLRRYRWKGLAVAALLGLPAVLFGGRSGAEAQSSAEHRLGCLSAGVEMFRGSPIFGVGYGQFMQHYSETAHNSYVFAPAELGVIGMLCWAMLMWISIKVSLRPAPRLGGDANEIQIWGDAMLATMVSIGVGIFFLTFNFHYLLWIIFGMAGAYHNACMNSQSGSSVRIGPKDAGLVVAANVTLLLVLRMYLHSKGL
jgi:hypothetical protein